MCKVSATFVAATTAVLLLLFSCCCVLQRFQLQLFFLIIDHDRSLRAIINSDSCIGAPNSQIDFFRSRPLTFCIVSVPNAVPAGGGETKKYNGPPTATHMHTHSMT